MESISILWPGEKQTLPVDFSGCVEDLQLGELACLLFPGRSSAEALQFASELTSGDPAVLEFRQAVIGDLLEKPELIEAFEKAQRLLEQMRSAVTGVRENPQGFTSGGVMNGFKETLEKLERLFGNKTNIIEESDLDNYYAQLFRATIFSYRLSRAYVELLELLQRELQGAGCRSQGLRQLKEWVDALCAADRMEESLKILEEIAAVWHGVGAFSVDILVDKSFNIMGMELTQIQPENYAKAGVVSARPGESYDGIGILTEFPMGGTTARFQECVITELGSALRSELLKLRSAVGRIPVSGVKLLLALEEELSFYTGTARFCRKLQEQGAEVTCPRLGQDCFQQVEGAYPVALRLVHKETPVANDILLPMGGTVNFITGANSSGKTTWLIAAGQLQWLYQLGCWLPCKKAVMRPVDGLYTLFASGESVSGEDSRMGMEAIKLAGFRDRMTDSSMILLNEPMTSTSAGEGIEICMDLLYELICRGISGMIVTHYNELYGMLRKRLLTENMEDRLRSFVMEIDQEAGVTRYPYRLRERVPDRSSHADEIVRKVGVTLRDMLQHFSTAGLDVRPEAAAWEKLHAPETEV